MDGKKAKLGIKIILLIMVGGFISCNKCDPWYKLGFITEEEKLHIPYQGYEELMYTNENHDTLVLYGKARSSFVKEVVIDTWSKCSPAGRYMLEIDTINFRSDNIAPLTMLNLELRVEENGTYDQPNTNTIIHVHINDWDYPYIEWDYQYHEWARSYESITVNSEREWDTVTIDGRFYQNVCYYKVNPNLYYSKEHGIIRFTTDSIVWTIVN
ncbi:MAG: hypothetical protein IH946_00185 [Bacteroidetes bacterium]|nr:hypothetical protein [Bacteroidota bacterium]